ncbi:MAG: hypothetical protein JSU04_14950 [Bdellovibrionales bacterium]|nr:hypothetical protein [Bdellovibrionales bacterium]
MKYVGTFLILLFGTNVWAQSSNKGAKAAAAPLSVNTGATASSTFNSVVLAGQVSRGGNGNVTFVVKNSCFGTNLRQVPNPLSPISTVTLVVGIRNSDGTTSTYWLKYPAGAVTATGMGQVMPLDKAMVSDSSKVRGTAIANVVRFKTPLATTATVDANGNMSFVRNGELVSLKFEQDFIQVQAVEQPAFPIYGPISNLLCSGCTSQAGAQGYLKRALPFKDMTEANKFFNDNPLVVANVSDDVTYNKNYQIWYNWFQEKLQVVRRGPGDDRGPYMGLPGDLAAHVLVNESRDGKTIEINAAFPGQEGYCGGYHSPLMVFFDDKRPKFTGESMFPLHLGKTTWPEKNAPGYFIALDKLGDGVITKKDELFGNSDEFKNGFEALRVLDTNHDGVIDEKDKDFKKLLLWQDKNGDGFSQRDELSPLYKRIKSISLDYDDKTVTSFGNRAEVKGRAKFIFIEKGQEKTGEVLDVWFTPAGSR